MKFKRQTITCVGENVNELNFSYTADRTVKWLQCFISISISLYITLYIIYIYILFISKGNKNMSTKKPIHKCLLTALFVTAKK